METDLDQAEGLSEKRREMLRYCIKLTKTPQLVAQDDVRRLSSVGFTDLDILHIVEVTAYYAYVNRIADGLGVMLEEDIKR